ncbi:U-box domain-containing protein 70-like [Triticum dicoccoides]|uniref:U-box domain-containing protein 70-like n=1 Tax=Triticum dicoccoides TaxID=85692 RepID=UPI00188F0697|nr:U-box domain-containing protein 70-like [Triticum dicoccoides]
MAGPPIIYVDCESFMNRKRKVPKSKVAAIVHLQAEPYCQIFYISNGTLACSREATQLSTKVESPRSNCTGTTWRPDFPKRCQSLSPGYPGFLGSTDQQAHQRRSKQPVSYTYPLLGSTTVNAENISGAMQRSIDMRLTGFSLNSSQQSTGGSSLALQDLNTMNSSPVHVSIASSKEHQHSMVETGVQLDVFEQLHRVHNELECSKKEASEGRQKAVRNLFEASMMFKARENALRKEKKELEDRLTRENTGLRKEHLYICKELQKANEQRAELENRVFSPTSDVALTEFTYTEINEAADNFDDSKNIGVGGCATVYKGFLRHTTVAIKKFNREDATGDKEFNDEVETLRRMRHPNLVTLIRVCKEAKALIFEFLSNGSLEDCLQCTDQREPLSWRTRIKIAADICTGHIFLHSNKPKGIAHGDLKPDNVLLDASFVCKLADFGISHHLNVTNTTITPYHRTNQIKGKMGYMDPAYIASGELTAQYDVYSYGVVLMRLLTNKRPLGLPHVVEAAIREGTLRDLIDTSAGEWPPECAEELARLALRCCRLERKERPNLAKEVWGVLQAIMNCQDQKCGPPAFFICPMTQEIMRDPHIAADGFTYEGDAIKDWFQMGNKISPMAYVNFAHHELIPNNALRFAIQEWQKRQQP